MVKEQEKLERRDEKRLKPRQVLLLIGLWIVSSLLSLLDWIALRAAVAAVTADRQLGSHRAAD